MEEQIISGIVKDFNYFSLKAKVEPAFISYDDKGSHLLVKPSDNQIVAANEAITSVWNSLIPDLPLYIESINDRFAWYHRDNANFKRLILSCSLISIFLSMIGLFTLSYQRTRNRIKEIGIRKINGSNIYQILNLINTDLFKQLISAFITAFPVSWLAMHKWLENYAYKIDMKWWVYVLSGIIVIVISVMTISWQSLKAVTRNPVEALRYE